jgi:hypothetical protein
MDLSGLRKEIIQFRSKPGTREPGVILLNDNDFEALKAEIMDFCAGTTKVGPDGAIDVLGVRIAQCSNTLEF